MSNSPLVNHTNISPNKNSPRNHKIDKITIHHMAGNLSVESCGKIFESADRQGSSNYGIDSNGRIGLYVDEKDRSWCSSSRENDHRAITIEVANDGRGPDWHVSDTALEATIKLCADICKRNGIERLNYTGGTNGNLTRHNMFASTICPGPYLQSKFPYIADEVNKLLENNSEASPESSKPSVPTTTKPINTNSSEYKIIEEVGPLFTADQKKTGVLACVSLAQYILESGWGKSDLAKNANNYFGMKQSLSGNTWPGSKWDGKSTYTIRTEEYSNGKYISTIGVFRKYSCMADSIEDHSAYLLGAKNGSSKRYVGLKGETDYKKAIQIIKDGGYATDPKYVTKVCALIEKWDLTRFNADSIASKPSVDKIQTTTNSNAGSLKKFVKEVQKAIGAKVDGIAGPETLGKTVTVSSKINNKHAIVSILQKRLYELGYTEVGKADGIAGPKFTSAVAHFQQDNGCIVDGEITKANKTWKKLLGLWAH